ncbi:MAG: hypothetical protein ACFFCI_00620 [Promethearchaeota archaeon]
MIENDEDLPGIIENDEEPEPTPILTFICPKHLLPFKTFKESISFNLPNFEGHFHADLIGCPKTHCIRILHTNPRECFCPKDRQTTSHERIKQLVKKTRSHAPK